MDEQNHGSPASSGDAYIDSQASQGGVAPSEQSQNGVPIGQSPPESNDNSSPVPAEASPERPGAADSYRNPEASGQAGGETAASQTPSPLSTEPKPVPGKRRARRVLGNVLFICFMVILALIVLFSLSPRIAGSEGTIFGYSVYIVRANSMSPTFTSGAVVFDKKKPASEIKEEDVITFMGAGENVTHRVVAVNYNPEEDSYSYTTRGDANNADDPNPVPYVNVRGVVLFGIPYLGHLLTLLRPPNLGLLIVVIPCLLIIVVELAKLVRLAKESKSQQ